MQLTPEAITAATNDEVIDFCSRLVQAETPNPPGDERAAADCVCEILEDLGLPYERIEAEPNRVNVVSSWGNGNGPTLLFNGHYDVVPATDVDAWPHPPFGGVVEDGKLYGRGSSDMKSGLATCLAAVSTLKRAGFEPNGKLMMHFVADEEAMGALGTKYLMDNGYCDGIDECLVGEPTSLNLVTSERGALWIEITTTGVSAHASAPHLGANAITQMSRIVDAIASMDLGARTDILGSPTVNVGVISGGAKVNSVPDVCTIEVDRRTLPGETKDEVIAQFQELLDKVAKQSDIDCNATIEPIMWADACESPPMRLTEFLREASKIYGEEAQELGFAGATDARFLNVYAGIPSIIFGPGVLSQAHTTGEYVECDKLIAGTKMYAHAFARFFETAK